MPSVQNGDMVWTSADLGALLDDKDLLNYLIAHIQASAPDAYVTVFQDPNACSSVARQLLGGNSQFGSPRSRKAPREGKAPVRRKPPAKGTTSKKRTAPKKRKAPSRGKKHHKR